MSLVPSTGHVDCLIVDDEAALSEATLEYFNMFDVRTAWVATAAECFDFLATHQVSLILLDVNLDDHSGFEVCKRLRNETDIPILFISARSSSDDMLLGLTIGGDDYITKPYLLSVLLAKVKAVLKRCGTAPGEPAGAAPGVVGRAHLDAAAPGAGPSSPGAHEVRFGDYRVDLASRLVFGPDGEVPLTTMEYRLLAHLLRHRGRVVSKIELFTQVWGSSLTSDSTLNVHIGRLRAKLDDADQRWITTVWGTGYLFASEE